MFGVGRVFRWRETRCSQLADLADFNSTFTCEAPLAAAGPRRFEFEVARLREAPLVPDRLGGAPYSISLARREASMNVLRAYLIAVALPLALVGCKTGQVASS